MGPLGFPELLFILVLALLIFGPRRIPEIGRTLGKAMGEFRRATNDFKRTLNMEAALEDEHRRPASQAAQAPTIEPSSQGSEPPPPSAESEEDAEVKPADEKAVEGAAPPGTEPRD